MDHENIDIVELPDNSLENIKANEIPPNQRKSQNRMSKFEKARILSLRTQHLKNGAKSLIDPNEYNLKFNNNYYYEIACIELKKKIIPFKIRRFYQNGKFETWNINELAIIEIEPNLN
jgi:DNA-directed RNA polymerase subunit K/omega